MINPVSIAVSGLLAAGKKMDVSASNIANADTIGSLDPTSPNQPYHAQQTQDVSTASGGVNTVSLDRNPAFVPSYAPDSPFANSEGLVGAPNVNLDEELIKGLSAEQAYKANAKVIATSRHMHDALMNAIDHKA